MKWNSSQKESKDILETYCAKIQTLIILRYNIFLKKLEMLTRFGINQSTNFQVEKTFNEWQKVRMVSQSPMPDVKSS